MKHVFISYSRKDYDDFVKNFIAELQDAKVPVWIDQKGLPPGTPDWEQTIRDAIRDAEVVLLVATVNSRKSEVVRDELEVARMEQIPIYPIWAKGEEERWLDCIPLGYSYRQRVDMREGHYDTGLSILLKALRGEDYHPVLDRVKRAAEEWDATGRPDYLLWVWEQQAPVYEVIEQLKPDLDETTQAFLVPEYERLLEQFSISPGYRQQNIIDRWDEIGKPCLKVMIQALYYVENDTGISELVLQELTRILQPYAFEATPAFIDYLSHEDSSIRRNAAQVLGDLEDIRAIKPLIDALDDKDSFVRRVSVDALGQLGDKQAVKPLIKLLNDDDTHIVKRSIIALARLNDGRAILPLSELLTDLRVPPVSRNSIFAYAATAIQQIDTDEAHTILERWSQEFSDLYEAWQSWKESYKYEWDFT